MKKKFPRQVRDIKPLEYLRFAFIVSNQFALFRYRPITAMCSYILYMWLKKSYILTLHPLVNMHVEKRGKIALV